MILRTICIVLIWPPLSTRTETVTGNDAASSYLSDIVLNTGNIDGRSSSGSVELYRLCLHVKRHMITIEKNKTQGLTSYLGRWMEMWSVLWVIAKVSFCSTSHCVENSSKEERERGNVRPFKWCTNALNSQAFMFSFWRRVIHRSGARWMSQPVWIQRRNIETLAVSLKGEERNWVTTAPILAIGLSNDGGK